MLVMEKYDIEDFRLKIVETTEHFVSNNMVDKSSNFAGGINKDTIQETVRAGATIVVVGAAIYGADSPAESAKELRALVEAA